MDKIDFTMPKEPVWLDCECGNRAMRVPCRGCTKAEEAKLEQQERDAAAGYPTRHAWAVHLSPLLVERVRVPALVNGRPGESVQQAMAAIEANRNSVLSGPAGCGKTSLAVAMARKLSDRVLFVRAEKLAQARAQSGLGHEAPLVERALSVPLLIIDDIGSDETTKLSALRDVIFDRFDADKATWVTTGLNAVEMERLYGEGIVRRIMHDASVIKWVKGRE